MKIHVSNCVLLLKSKNLYLHTKIPVRQLNTVNVHHITTQSILFGCAMDLHCCPDMIKTHQPDVLHNWVSEFRKTIIPLEIVWLLLTSDNSTVILRFWRLRCFLSLPEILTPWCCDQSSQEVRRTHAGLLFFSSQKIGLYDFGCLFVVVLTLQKEWTWDRSDASLMAQSWIVTIWFNSIFCFKTDLHGNRFNAHFFSPFTWSSKYASLCAWMIFSFCWIWMLF